MKSLKYGIFVTCTAFMAVLGHAEGRLRSSTDEAFKASIQPDVSKQKKERGAVKEAVSDKAAGHMGNINHQAPARHTGSVQKGMDSKDRGGKIERGNRGERHGKRLDRRHFGDERRGRTWYRSYLNRFWAADFMWPRPVIFTTFFTGLIPQLETLDIPDDQYQVLMSEIEELQSMLAQQQNQNMALNQALRRRLVDIIGKLVEQVPGIDVQGVFEGK